jgi:two-component system, OmpR family, phosphate regulon sensor histidine kinase PhoR
VSADLVRVLVVDDERGVREGCRKILAAEGFDVVTAEDGQAGLEAFEREKGFAVALVDQMMPRLSGLELIRRLRVLDPDLTLIIITAHATIDSAVEGTKQGAYTYIPKPFTADELLLAIKNGLERRSLTLEAKRLRDERERRLLEVASERSRSNTIISCMTDGILVVNTERLVVLRNAAAAVALPDCAERPVPFPLDDLASVELKEMVSEALGAGGGPHIVSREISSPGATYMVNASPILDVGGETSGAVAVFRDVTAMKQLETAKSTFVSMVAHEVKNPLAAAEGWLNLILSGVVKDDPAEERKVIERALLRMKTLRTLVAELLNLTAIETGNFTLRRVRTDILAVVNEVVESYRDRAKEKGVTLCMNAAKGASSVQALADRDAMAMVYSNLVDNAIKYTPAGGHVSVDLFWDGLNVRVSVKDDGIGMEPGDRQHAFEEFYRAKNELTANIPGTGLGLSLVKRITELHHGQVTAESVPGKGSTFAVRIPVS